MFWHRVSRQQGVVPFWISTVWLKVQLLHLLVGDLHSGLIDAWVQYRLNVQSLSGLGGADHVDDCLEADEWFPSPVHADEGEHPVLDLIPFACPRWIMADYHFKPGLVAELLEVVFPGPVPGRVASPAVGADEQALGVGVVADSKLEPPSPDALYGKLRRVMRHSDVHHPFVPIDVIGSVGDRRALCQTREVVDVDLRSLTLLVPLPPVILEISDSFLLLGVHRDHRFLCLQKSFRCLADISELAVPVGVGFTFLVL